MNAKRFGVRAILLGLIAAAATALLGSAGTAVAEPEYDGCGDSSAFARTLPQVWPGQSGTYVMGLQRALAREGYPLVGTGWYGSKTLAAVRDFQGKRGINPSGIVGQRTWQSLVGRKPECATRNGGQDFLPSFGVRPGDRDSRHLIELQDHFLLIKLDTQLPMDESYYGPRWQAVVKNFQLANGIRPSGIVGPKTWRALNLVISISGGWSCGC